MRIQAGEFKGRVLLGPPKGGPTRPITGLACKSLMDTLAPALDGGLVLDLYCGTGTLGFEALSRGAERACFADRAGPVLKLLRQNIQTLGATERCTVWAGEIEARLAGWLNGLSEPVSVAFVDPPYASAERWDWSRVGEVIFAPLAARLADGGTVVLRLPARVAVPEAVGGLSVRRRKEFGDMAILYLRC